MDSGHATVRLQPVRLGVAGSLVVRFAMTELQRKSAERWCNEMTRQGFVTYQYADHVWVFPHERFIKGPYGHLRLILKVAQARIAEVLHERVE